MVMPAQALIPNRIPASTQLPKFEAFIDFNCAANLGGAAVLKRNGNCSGGGPPIMGATLFAMITLRYVKINSIRLKTQPWQPMKLQAPHG